MTTAEQAAVQRATDRGTLMFHYDQAAWHGSDALKRDIGDRLGSVGGWVVDGPAEAPEIVFFDKDRVEPHAIYIADLRDDRLTAGHVVMDAEKALSPTRKRMVMALRTARTTLIAAKVTPCTPAPFNTIVIPPAKPEDPIAVYFLTAQTETQTIPFGGHYVVEVGADGIATAPRPFTKACINMTPPPSRDGQPVGMVVTQLLTPTPTEIHVFSMLASRKPVYVGTEAGIWVVSATKGQAEIRLLQRRIPKP